jgi:hypothetical protein
VIALKGICSAMEKLDLMVRRKLNFTLFDGEEVDAGLFRDNLVAASAAYPGLSVQGLRV